MKVHPLEEDDGTQQCDDTFSTSDSVDAFRADAPGTQARRRVLYVPVAISEASISLRRHVMTSRLARRTVATS